MELLWLIHLIFAFLLNTVEPCPFDEIPDNAPRIPTIETIWLDPPKHLTCGWNAQTRGNGEGESFIVLDGIIWYDPLP